MKTLFPPIFFGFEIAPSCDSKEMFQFDEVIACSPNTPSFFKFQLVVVIPSRVTVSI